MQLKTQAGISLFLAHFFFTKLIINVRLHIQLMSFKIASAFCLGFFSFQTSLRATRGNMLPASCGLSGLTLAVALQTWYSRRARLESCTHFAWFSCAPPGRCRDMTLNVPLALPSRSASVTCQRMGDWFA
jgi:hypothetical protein